MNLLGVNAFTSFDDFFTYFEFTEKNENKNNKKRIRMELMCFDLKSKLIISDLKAINRYSFAFGLRSLIFGHVKA